MSRHLSARCAICQYPITQACNSVTDRWVCLHCDSALPRLHNVCRTCGQELPSKTQSEKCGACLKSAPAIDRLVAAFDYDYPINLWLPKLKFERFSSLAKWLGAALATTIACQEEQLPECIIPVPLHPRRLRERGYNQAELIAKAMIEQLSHAHPLILDTTSCRRKLYTKAQSGLSLKQRQQNIRAAFEATPIAQRHVAIVDDVYTSGSTINALAKCLKQAGAEQVSAFVVAHAALK